MEAVPLDDFFAAQSIERAQLVTIDCEGWDGRVLQGMRRVLQACMQLGVRAFY